MKWRLVPGKPRQRVECHGRGPRSLTRTQVETVQHCLTTGKMTITETAKSLGLTIAIVRGIALLKTYTDIPAPYGAELLLQPDDPRVKRVLELQRTTALGQIDIARKLNLSRTQVVNILNHYHLGRS